MAETVPSSASTRGQRTSTDPTTLVAALGALTSAFVASTNDVICLGWELANLGLDYVNGDETSVQIKPQAYDGATWRDLTYKAPQSGNVSEIVPDVLQLTKATYSTIYGAGVLGSVAVPPLDCRGAQKLRVARMATGGTPTGTLGITATLGRRSVS